MLASRTLSTGSRFHPPPQPGVEEGHLCFPEAQNGLTEGKTSPKPAARQVVGPRLAPRWAQSWRHSAWRRPCAQPHGDHRVVLSSPNKLDVKLSRDPAMPLLGVDPKGLKTRTQTAACRPGPRLDSQPPKGQNKPDAHQETTECGPLHSGQSSALKTGMELENVILRKRSQTPRPYAAQPLTGGAWRRHSCGDRQLPEGARARRGGGQGSMAQSLCST